MSNTDSGSHEHRSTYAVVSELGFILPKKDKTRKPEPAATSNNGTVDPPITMPPKDKTLRLKKSGISLLVEAERAETARKSAIAARDSSEKTVQAESSTVNSTASGSCQ